MRSLSTTQTLTEIAQQYQKAELLLDGLDTSESTRDDYKYRIQNFLDFIDGKPLNSSTYLEYKRQLQKRNDWSVATKSKYLTAARVFLKEANRVGLIPVDISLNVKGFTKDKKHKKEGVSLLEISQLVERLNTLPDSLDSSRLKAIFSLLILQGLRQIEIVRLDVHDIDLIANKAFVQGKGKDDKEPIDLHPQTAQLIKRYITQGKIKDGPLFFSRSNNGRNNRISTRSVRGMVKDLLNEMGIPKSTHGFRHFFVTNLVEKFGGNLLDVAAYSRHKSLEMLQVYYDRVKKQEDLPRYYKAFSGIEF